MHADWYKKNVGCEMPRVIFRTGTLAHTTAHLFVARMQKPMGSAVHSCLWRFYMSCDANRLIVLRGMFYPSIQLDLYPRGNTANTYFALRGSLAGVVNYPR